MLLVTYKTKTFILQKTEVFWYNNFRRWTTTTVNHFRPVPFSLIFQNSASGHVCFISLKAFTSQQHLYQGNNNNFNKFRFHFEIVIITEIIEVYVSTIGCEENIQILYIFDNAKILGIWTVLMMSIIEYWKRYCYTLQFAYIFCRLVGPFLL